jgi:hypothetical protein
MPAPELEQCGIEETEEVTQETAIYRLCFPLKNVAPLTVNVVKHGQGVFKRRGGSREFGLRVHLGKLVTRWLVEGGKEFRQTMSPRAHLINDRGVQVDPRRLLD